jgi:hypothetical protein
MVRWKIQAATPHDAAQSQNGDARPKARATGPPNGCPAMKPTLNEA